jgi:hypothetical protein
MPNETSNRRTLARRRDVLRALGVGAGAAITGSVPDAAQAAPKNQDEKRKSRYRADSPEVQTHYRVNRYPR